MGTNYYVWAWDVDTDSAFEGPVSLHLGKSSMGWVFSLRAHPELGLKSLSDWLPVLVNPRNTIRDEYGVVVEADQMIKTIVCRKRHGAPLSKLMSTTELEKLLRENNAQVGPNELLRHNPLTKYNLEVEHGEGTWDVCFYEFC